MADAGKKNINAHWFENREDVGDFILEQARPKDRVVIMGARDDTLHVFAKSLLEQL